MGFVECVSKWATFALGFQWGTSAARYPPQFPSIERRSISTVVERATQHFPSTHNLPHDHSFCNTPNNRECWLEGFDINTDYDRTWPKGVKREFWLDVAYGDIAPDGFTRRAQLINGTFPGPLIEANWGDELTIHVTNHLSLQGEPEYDNGTTIHWHGVRQLGTNEADGVNGVTQCPIPPGQSYTYKFVATQYGHSWYHSHYSLQYPDGVYGPLLIHGPTSANWDVDMGVISLSDWHHPNAFVMFSIGELQNIGGRASNSTVINGKGIFPCQATDEDPSANCSGRGGSRFETVVQKGKRYLMRLVNTSADMQFLFSIDNHMLEVIQTDFVPIEPYMAESISIGIGQRYTVVVTANPNSTAPFPPAPTDGNFWIRTIPLEDCGDIADGYWPTYGIMRYSNQGNFNSSETALADPVSKPYDLKYHAVGALPECADEPPTDSHPIVPWTVGSPADSQDLRVGVDLNRPHGFIRWQVGGEPLWLDWASPTITNLDNTTWNPEYDVFVENLDDEWVYFIIQGDFNNASTPGLAPVPVAAHPMHLHGHDFAILAQGVGRWDELDPKPALNLNNPLRRDVALLPNLGYLVIAFKTDNPGVWLMHCHIAWHQSSGLALQLLERQSEIKATIKDEEQINDTCAAWVDYTQKVVIEQDDSGI